MSRDSSRRRIWVVGLALAVAMVPALAFAAHPAGDFEDVPEDHTFHDDIQWMHNNGITRGCNPPDNDEYCPDRALIRAEEAAFFHRYDNFLRNDLDAQNRLLPVDCTENQIAEFNGESWECSDRVDIAPPDGDELSLAPSDPITIAAAATETFAASCAEGETAVFGTTVPTNGDLDISQTITNGEIEFEVTNNGAEEVIVTGYALCTSA